MAESVCWNRPGSNLRRRRCAFCVVRKGLWLYKYKRDLSRPLMHGANKLEHIRVRALANSEGRACFSSSRVIRICKTLFGCARVYIGKKDLRRWIAATFIARPKTLDIPKRNLWVEQHLIKSWERYCCSWDMRTELSLSPKKRLDELAALKAHFNNGSKSWQWKWQKKQSYLPGTSAVWK